MTSRKFYDTVTDVLEISGFEGNGVKFVTTEAFGGIGGTTRLEFTEEQAKAIRDYLIELYPLCKIDDFKGCTVEAFTPTNSSPNITINVAGNLIVNNIEEKK